MPGNRGDLPGCIEKIIQVYLDLREVESCEWNNGHLTNEDCLIAYDFVISPKFWYSYNA